MSTKGKKWAEKLNSKNDKLDEERQALISQNAENLIKQANNESENASNSNINKSSNENSENEIIETINSNSRSQVDPLDALLNAENEELLYRGYYLEKEVVKVIEKMGKKGGKGRGGIKSKIVNEALKQVFKEKGWM